MFVTLLWYPLDSRDGPLPDSPSQKEVCWSGIPSIYAGSHTCILVVAKSYN